MASEDKGLDRNPTQLGDRDFALYLRRSFARSMGYSTKMLERSVVGIATATSDFNNCHRTSPEIVAAVKRGVLVAGGLPLEFPTISIGAAFVHPTGLLLRNLMAMDVEESIRAQPMDAVVLVGGCDDTVPAQLMGAISAGRPFIQLVTGPMLTGRYRGGRTGACTDCRRFWARFRAGALAAADIEEVEGALAVTAGTCPVMGTASTMACIAEALGVSLPGTAAIPAVHADRLRAAEATGRRAVELAAGGLTPETVITPASVENALRVLLAVSGSTNGIVHLAAIAGRLGIEVSLRRLNELGRTTPVLVDLKPVGDRYMEDLFAAGGMGAVLRELRPLLRTDTVSVAGETLDDRLARPAGYVDRTVVRPLDDPVRAEGGLVALFGTLASRGAIIKRSVAEPARMESEGRAVVFSSLDDLARRIDDPGSGRDARRRPGAQERGPGGRGYAGGGAAADPAEAGAGRGQGHGAYLGRSHERDRRWHRRAPRGTGGRRRGPAGTGGDGRSDSAERVGEAPRPSGDRGRVGETEDEPTRGSREGPAAQGISSPLSRARAASGRGLRL